jgi:tetratricopeptide (TPR) repeat protein
MRRLVVYLTAALLMLGASSVARAHGVSGSLEKPVVAPAGYDEASSKGVRAFAAGKYLEARGHFTDAHRIWPTARSLRALGHCEYELRNYAVAVGLLEQSLASNERPLDEVQRAESEELLTRARGYVAYFKITTIPEHSHVTIDGLPMAAMRTGVLLSVGLHFVEVSAEGHHTRRRELEIQGAVDQEILVELLPNAPVYEGPGPLREEPLRKKWWLWTGVGGVVTASVITGLVLALRDPTVRDPSGGNSGVVIVVPPAPQP